MTPDFTVHDYGIDSSSRTIWMTAYMYSWWDDVVAELGFRPVIIQGAFMVRDGGGAHDSSGYHDAAGCMDVRSRDLTTAQIDSLVRVCRQRGAAAWRRDLTPAHGAMDSHCHITLGSDQPLSAGAKVSWASYLAGGDGLAGPGRDYEWRPTPLVLTPPLEDEVVTPQDVQTIVAAFLAAKPDGSDLTVGQLLKQGTKASQEARDLLAGQNKAASHKGVR